MKIVFFHHLDAFHVISKCLLSRSYVDIYYFNISKPSKVLLGLLRLNKRIKYFKFHLYEIRDAKGESYGPKICGENLIDICDKIREEMFQKNHFINAFGKIFNTKKVEIFFRKFAKEEIEDIVIFITVIAWYRQRLTEKRPNVIEFSIEKTHLFNTLKEFASKEHGVNLNSSVSFRKILKFFYQFAGEFYLSTLVCLSPMIHTLKGFNRHSRQIAANTTSPLIASLYTLRGLTFDSAKRCDFPWLLMSDIPKEQVLLYFERKDKPLTNNMVSELKQQRISYMAMSKGATNSKEVPLYKPTVSVTKTLCSLMLKVFFLVCKEIFTGRFNSLTYLSKTLHFIREYAKAYDFYCSNGIKINIDFIDHDPYRIPRHLALDAVGGISISHQITNWPIPNIILGSCADVMFLFGPYYYQTFLKSGSCNNSVIFLGYLADYSFVTVREHSRSLRKKLTDKGAKFVICYFDENSSDGRMSIIPNKRSALIYKHFLEWVLSDETLGLICSPKRPKTLSARLPEIVDLIKKAKDTGRCIFMDGEYAADNYPTEAAQAADVAISLLIGGTTSLENFLSGVRVVYFDLEGLYSYPEYKSGKNNLVFDNLNNLTSAINKYRTNREAFDEFGNINLAPGIKDKDPFRDGRAAERMGQYINWLLEMFNQGKTREEAIEYANRKYVELWGRENVIKWH